MGGNAEILRPARKSRSASILAAAEASQAIAEEG
jgi:hypothetical protein